jgi:hypothetical protein
MDIMVKVGEFVLAMDQPKKLLFIRSCYNSSLTCTERDILYIRGTHLYLVVKRIDCVFPQTKALLFLSPRHGFPASYVMGFICSVVNCFVDMCGFSYHHLLLLIQKIK